MFKKSGGYDKAKAKKQGEKAFKNWMKREHPEVPLPKTPKIRKKKGT